MSTRPNASRAFSRKRFEDSPSRTSCSTAIARPVKVFALFSGGAVDVGHYNRCAGGTQPLGDSQPYAACRTHNDGNAPVEISHTFLPLKFSKISKLWLVGLLSDTRPAQSRCDRPDNRHVIAPHLLCGSGADRRPFLTPTVSVAFINTARSP
jgi:hypothetical protein